MKINSTVVLTLILLTLMLGAGSVSAFLGFSMGSSALKGVSSPDGRPTSKFASNRNNNAESDRVNLLKEEDIIKAVKARMQDNKTDNKAQKREEEEEITAKKSEAAQKREEVAEEKLEPGFPVVAESEGVTMSVQSVRYSGGDLILRVKMQNQANDTVRFLYSFLDVTDDKGRTLSAITEGLPAELPGKSPTFTGTISIPTALLDDVSSVSLALTDYPAQKLKLQVSDIPVEK
ncbi:hypothetical protein SR1949_51520 [Sphaerospermopsis reniformis]|uniref:Uncharacterized protein n=1 Tax=Sphaerospermopsis reniformis TaxID=531300 RepID=A0A480A5B2_9CYAN|nr:hypothetical protein [Sphaerospermopsis reniformis]GCL40019.1 hypothetical protein SR1949_51520 [Sphaerospermopsis reniformis]